MPRRTEVLAELVDRLLKMSYEEKVRRVEVAVEAFARRRKEKGAYGT